MANPSSFQVSKMEFSFQREREQMRRVTEIEDGKRLLLKSKPKPSVELPFDVMVSILTRLPPRHLRRMRSICRSWSLLISDSHFIRKHSKFRASVTKRPYIVSLFYNPGQQIGRKIKLFHEGDDYHREFDMIMDLVRGQFCKMSNSCDGLICVVGRTFTYLVNPSIQKVRMLMRRSCHVNTPDLHSAGLGFNDSTGEYKVVRIFYRNADQHEYLGCEVHTVGSLHSPSCWKVIDGPPLKPSPYSLPVFVNGAIHWTVTNGLHEVPPEVALSYDVKSEKFDVILHPEGNSRPPCSRVVKLGGLLCLACTHRDGLLMDIWVLKDYNNHEWIKQYIIDLSTSFGFATRPVTIYDGKIVFCNGNATRDYYDPQSKTFVERMHVSTCFVNGTPYTESTSYTESVIWPIGKDHHV